MDKTFLFDIHSRIYVATDGSPIEQSTFDLCSDYLEKLLQFRALYRCASLAFRADIQKHQAVPAEQVTDRDQQLAYRAYG